MSKHHGRTTRRWRKLTARLQREAQHKNLPCHICQQPIDWTRTNPDPKSFSADHIIPVSIEPKLAETYSNIAPSHLSCNSRRQQGGPTRPQQQLGTTSRNWGVGGG